MFILEVTYTVPLDQVDVPLMDHVAWLKEQFAAGRFLASGPKVPRDGGIILAVADSREEVESLAATDPFVTGKVAEYRITEFLATMTVPSLDAFRQTPPA